ncbi:heme oxygenase-domain-containing protein [Radiomyces spectabilis]|uniref:heme oxygenase-domain-containing protein n=1 Tax=Radiomyces spectabilis TaxID=64574 RepID=UPI002220D8A5|nr:heme oxygenase-domain-containing protein [Radiomyces spectabilis]KAI8379751.1 heme oxygenase-domain-containing protein [Radiomyces spectabilis]
MSHYTLVSKKSMAAQDDPILENPELASAMREGTKVVHRAAESSVFTKKFLKGDITKDEYGQYISSLYFIYSTMERLLRSHKNHPVLQNICFPTELEREQALLNDLEFYYGKERLPELTSPLSMTPAVKAYVQSLEAACSVDPLLLVAHSYSRYLGDLSGGQILARRLKKHVLNLEKDDASWDSEDGLHFYQFNNIGNHNQFKTLYRERLDTLQVNSRTKAMIVAEAIRSFELNIAVFDEIQAISDAKQLKPTMITDDVTKPTVSTWLANPLYVASAGIAVASVGLIAYQRYVRNA